MVLNVSSSNENSIWCDIFDLESLKSLGIKVLDVGWESLDWHSEATKAVGSPEYKVIEADSGSNVLLKGLRVLIGVHSDSSGYCTSRLEGAVAGHAEDIVYIVGQAFSLEDGALLVVVHLEPSSGHLDHSVVYSLVGHKDSLVVGVLDGKEGAGGLVGLVRGSYIQEDLEVDVSGELGALADHCDSIGKFGHLGLGFDWGSHFWGMVDQGESRVGSGSL